MSDSPFVARPYSNVWIKTIKLIPRYAWLSLLRTSEFKFNFYTYTLLYLSQMVFYCFFWKSLAPPPIEGWTVQNYYLLTGFVTLNSALQEILWSTGMIDLMILDGSLLVTLCRPLNSYFGMVMRWMSAMSMLMVVMGLALILVTLAKFGSPPLWRLAAALSCCLAGAVCLRAVLVFLGAFSFKLGRLSAPKAIVFSTKDIARFPLSFLHPAIIGMFTFVLPAMAIGTTPTRVLMMSSPAQAIGLLLLTLFITLVWVFLAAKMWTRGLRDYEGLTGI